MISAILLGSGGATPYARRTTPMVFVETVERKFLFDCGSGATLRIAQSGINCGHIDAVFLTHFHADHCVDLPIVILTSYLAGRKQPLEIYGPVGTVNFIESFFYNIFSYIPHLIGNVTDVKFEMNVREIKPGEVLNFSDCAINIGEAKHGENSICYRVTTASESIAISGDTEPCDSVIEISKDASLLIHECPFPESFGPTPGHTTPSQLGEIARKARVHTVVLTHLFEECVGNEEAMTMDVKKSFGGQVVIGEDLTKFIVNSTDIKNYIITI